MGSLVWLGYLSHTQVVESSNLSSSIDKIKLPELTYVKSNIRIYTTKVMARNIFVTRKDFSNAFE